MELTAQDCRDFIEEIPEEYYWQWLPNGQSLAERSLLRFIRTFGNDTMYQIYLKSLAKKRR